MARLAWIAAIPVLLAALLAAPALASADAPKDRHRPCGKAGDPDLTVKLWRLAPKTSCPFAKATAKAWINEVEALGHFKGRIVVYPYSHAKKQRLRTVCRTRGPGGNYTETGNKRVRCTGEHNTGTKIRLVWKDWGGA